MVEMTLYGRGGQGGVTLAKLIATAYFLRGKYAQAFGLYAAERSGAPIQAFVRVDDDEITNHNLIREPDHVIVLDPTLIGPNILTGLKPDGWIILNSHLPAGAWGAAFPGRRVATVDATGIAVSNGLGTRAVPILNTTIMGAVARVFGLAFDEVVTAFEELKFGGANLTAAKEAFELVTMEKLAGTQETTVAPRPPERIPSILDEDLGAPPKVRTGSWATRRPDRQTLTPPCNHTCPAGNDVQRFVNAISRKSYDEALAIILETSPLPGICGRVCPAPCMEVCNRIEFDEGVNVRELERYASDHGRWPEPSTPTRHERIAVVGSGPAGLSAAYHLAKIGYHVALYEGADELGGVLRNGIPEYRLPREVIDRELGWILMHGVTAYTDSYITRGGLLDLTNHYSAVFVGTGLQDSRSVDLGGAPDGVVRQGIEFLDSVHRHEESIEGKHVIVVGGGNTAIDAARSSRRLGAASVKIFYRRSRKEMPAIAEEIDAAIEEGIELRELVLPLRVSPNGGSAEMTVVRMKLGEPDKSGRRQPIKDDAPDAQSVVPCDMVILALGQSADLSILNEGAEIRENGALLGLAGAPVFMGGDVATNEGTVTAAIGSGRRAAWHIHRALTGEDLFPKPEAPVATLEAIRMHIFEHAPRQRGGTIARELRETSFAEVHVGLLEHEGESAAVAEAERCFSCGVCNTCDRCMTYCPEGILLRAGDDYEFNYDYCKGCGICASQCPRGVVIMSEL